jgi:hypothetical protein
VTSSDALRNSPFILDSSSPSGSDVDFTADETYAKMYSSQGQAAQVNVIKVPKSAIGYVTVGKFKTTEKVTHMPMVSFKLGSVFATLICGQLVPNLFCRPSFSNAR